MTTPTPAQDLHHAFEYLYPDVDPTTPIQIGITQHISLCVATATLAFGAATGDLIILIAGVVFVIFALAAMASHPRWRIRREARARFPQEPWATTKSSRLVPVFWLVIATTCLAVLYLTPNTWGGIGAAMVAALATWFMPGISPVWRR